jgi:hypothetical protein
MDMNWNEFWWTDKYFAMNFIWKMMVMNLLVIKNEVQNNSKIRDIIDKLERKHLIFMFNSLIQNNKSAKTISIYDLDVMYHMSVSNCCQELS